MPNKDKKDVEEYSRPSYEPGSKAQAKMAYQNSYIAKGEKASNSARYEAKLRALKKIGKDGRSEFEKKDMIDFSKKADGSSRLYK